MSGVLHDNETERTYGRLLSGQHKAIDSENRSQNSFHNASSIQNQAGVQYNQGPVHHGPVHYYYTSGTTTTGPRGRYDHIRDQHIEPSGLYSEVHKVSLRGELTRTDEERWSYYLELLKFLAMDSRLLTIEKAYPETCQWLLKQPEYHQWMDIEKLPDHRGFFWLKGKPATGKSTITKFAYVNAKKDKSTTIIGYFFHARGEALERSTTGMYRSLLWQLLSKLPDLQEVFDTEDINLRTVVKRFQDTDEDINSPLWNQETLRTLFDLAIERLGSRRLTCFIDALDECEETEVRDMVKFFERLSRMLTSAGPTIRIWFSSRHYPHITIKHGVTIILEDQNGHHEDLAVYVNSELSIGSGKLADNIRQDILRRASDVFLWVVLVVRILNLEHDHGQMHALTKRLEELPDGLEQLFDDILDRNGRPQDLVLCVQWVLYARRPLLARSLYYAILSGIQQDSFSIWHSEQIHDSDVDRYLLNASRGLIQISKGTRKTVEFIHESVRDFFLRGTGLNRPVFAPKATFMVRSHEQLKQCCQNYYTSIFLSLTTAKLNTETSVPLRAGLHGAPYEHFLLYALSEVLYHSEAAHSITCPQDQFLQQFPLSAWFSLTDSSETMWFFHGDKARIGVNVERLGYTIYHSPIGLDLLYVLTIFGLPNLIHVILKSYDSQDDQTSHKGRYYRRYEFSMLAALAMGNEQVLYAFMNPNHEQHNLLTKKEKISEVITFLEHEVSLQTDGQETPLLWAVQNADFILTKGLLETKRCDVNARGRKGRTPLLWAAADGQLEILKLLLVEDDIEVNATDLNGWSPLSFAARNGKWAMVKTLIAQSNINLNQKTSEGWTPLCQATYGGHLEVAQLLLDTRLVDVNNEDTNGWTPLTKAVARGDEKLVELLLLQTTIKVNQKSFEDRIVVESAESDYVDVDCPMVGRIHTSIDSVGRSPLSRAAEHGRQRIVQRILSHDDIDVDSRDYCNRTALHWAARCDNLEAAKILLQSGKFDLDCKDRYGRTPMSWAAQARGSDVFELFASFLADQHDPYGCERLIRLERQNRLFQKEEE